MNKLLLGQVLGAVFSNAARRRGVPGSFGGTGMGGGAMGGLGGAALGGVLSGMLGGRGMRGGGLRGNRAALLAVLLPFALRWVQNNGGLGAVLQRVQQRGFGRQANSWVAPGENEAIDPAAVDDIVGPQELSRLSQELDVPPDDVRQGFAELLPQMVDQLTPDGQLRGEADDVLQESIPLVEDELQQARRENAH